MNPPPKTVRTESPSSAGDLWGGVAAMLVALPSSIAFGIVAYTSIGPEYAGAGAMAGILGAAVLGVIAPLYGRTAGLISAPCAPAAAVLSAFAAQLLAASQQNGIQPEQIPSLLALAALLAAGLQILYGAVGGGQLIKFIPFPVVSGYLSAVGVLIAIGQLPKLLGLPRGIPLARGLVSPELWQWHGLVVGLVTVVVIQVAHSITQRVPAAIVGLMAGILTYFILALFSPELLQLQGNPLIIGPIQASGSLFGAIAERATSLFTVDVSSLRLIIVPAITLSVLLSIDTLKTCVGLDVLTRARHNSDRELMGQGFGNLAACLAGGMPGAGTMGPTLVNVASGGRTPRSGVLEGSLVIVAFLLFGRLIAWVPIGALSGILLVIAWRMFDKSMFRLLRHPVGRFDFAVIVGVIFVAIMVDLIAASIVGVALAILLFIRDQIHWTVIRKKQYLNQISSKTRRLLAERTILNQHGGQGVICELQGNLFFGTTDQLYSRLENDLRTKRYILLDLRRVQSIDYTAAHLFENMHAQLAERGGQLLFSGMPSAVLDQRNFEHYLSELGVVREGAGIMISETLDGALEWMEDRILRDAGAPKRNDEQELKMADFDLFRGFDETTLNKLSACMTERLVKEGEKVFACGEQGDDIFLIRRGSVRVMLPLEGGKRHHLATISAGDFFGELNFLDHGVRTADAEAKIDCSLYVLSFTRFREQTRDDADTAAHFFARLAHTVAVRLREADSELRAAEER